MKQNVYVSEILITEFVVNKGLNRNSGLAGEESGETPCGVAKRVFRRVRRRTPHNAAGLCRKEKRKIRKEKQTNDYFSAAPSFSSLPESALSR